MREVVPFRERKFDWILWGFFFVNLTFISYQVDIEQLVIQDPDNFEYPVWPLPVIVDMVHWWGRNFDPALMARPVWWKMTIWIDQVFFGPFYAAALYAFWRGRDWIRNWCFLWAATMMTNVTIILGEEIAGDHATENLGVVLFANASWFLFPVFAIARMWRPHPFTREAASPDSA
jgi:hypothetical protein